MKAKLIKDHTNYHLVDDKQFIIGTTDESMLSCTDKHKLSLSNCQEIERGYDLDELAKNYLLNKWLPNTNKEDRELWYLTTDWSKEVVKIIKNFYIELMSDKKFSEEDIIDCWETAHQAGRFEEKGIAETNWQTAINYAQSLQQTEWDVEIEMEEGKVVESHVESHVWDGTNHGELTWVKQPKLDADGCLILRLL